MSRHNLKLINTIKSIALIDFNDFLTYFVILQTISAQCIGAGLYGSNINPVASAAYANGLAYGPLAETPEINTFDGGGLQVTSYSPIAPTGVSIRAEDLLIEGSLGVTGQMPFLGVVAVEGPLTAVGQGAVAYECGNGNIGITSEGSDGVNPEYTNNIGVANSMNGLSYPNIGYGQRY